MTSTEIEVQTKKKMGKTLENIKVNCYGSLMPIKQLANIAAPESQLIIISPYDLSILKDIEKAIQQSELGLTTNNDGKSIRIPIPPLSGDRREKIVTQIKEMTEEIKISIRNIRREANKQIEKEEKDSLLTEDEAKKAKEQIQKFTHDNEARLNELLRHKSEEILKI